MNIIKKSLAAACVVVSLGLPFASIADGAGIWLGPVGLGVGTSNYYHHSYHNRGYCRWVNGHYKHYHGHRHWVRGYRTC